PARKHRVDRADGDEQAFAAATALIGEAGIHARDVFVQKGVETAGPSFGDAMGAQLPDERRRSAQCLVGEGRLAEGNAGVDETGGRGLGGVCAKRGSCGDGCLDEAATGKANHSLTPFALRIGSMRRLRFSPRMSLRAVSGMFAPNTFASWEAKLRPPVSLPYSTRSGPSSRTAISVKPATGSEPARSESTFLRVRMARMPSSQSPPV